MNDKINAAIICNNFGEIYDGIGSYSRIIYTNDFKYIQTKIYSGICRADKGIIHRFTNLEMTKAFIKLMRDIRQNKGKLCNVVIIEYPFIEWNPFIYVPLFFLSKMASRYRFKIITSVHEYSRVNYFRKKIIEYLCRISDGIFVSNKDMQSELEDYCAESFLRDIPTNIFSKDIQFENKNDKKQYVYFGLVGKTKAFYEMLEGWNRFNENGEYTLHVLSGTKLEGMEKYKGVNYIYDCPDDKILQLMKSSAYCVVPIKPYVDEKNATFKTGCLGECVSIGIFGKEFSELPFVMNMENYSADDFEKIFVRSQEIDDVKLSEMQKAAYEFGNRYTPIAVAASIEQNILSVFDEDRAK